MLTWRVWGFGNTAGQLHGDAAILPGWHGTDACVGDAVGGAGAIGNRIRTTSGASGLRRSKHNFGVSFQNLLVFRTLATLWREILF